MKKCPECKAKSENYERYCGVCGYVFESPVTDRQTTKTKDKKQPALQFPVFRPGTPALQKAAVIAVIAIVAFSVISSAVIFFLNFDAPYSYEYNYCEEVSYYDIGSTPYTEYITEIPDDAFIFEQGYLENDIKWEAYGLPDGMILLHISGKGRIEDMDAENIPWDLMKTNVGSIIIDEGITYIGSYVFSGLGNVVCVTIPSSVREISEFAFMFCDCIEKIYYGGTADQWEKLDLPYELIDPITIFINEENTL